MDPGDRSSRAVVGGGDGERSEIAPQDVFFDSRDLAIFQAAGLVTEEIAKWARVNQASCSGSEGTTTTDEPKSPAGDDPGQRAGVCIEYLVHRQL